MLLLVVCAGIFLFFAVPNPCYFFNDGRNALRASATQSDTREGTLASAPLQSDLVRLYDGVPGIIAELIAMDKPPRAITIQGPQDDRNLGTGGVATCVAVCGIARTAQGKQVIAEAHWSGGYRASGYSGGTSKSTEAAFDEFLRTMHREEALDDTIEIYFLGIWRTDPEFRGRIRAVAQKFPHYVKGVFFNEGRDYIAVAVTHEGIIYYDDFRNRAEPMAGSTNTVRYFGLDAEWRLSRQGNPTHIDAYEDFSRTPLRQEVLPAPASSA